MRFKPEFGCRDLSIAGRTPPVLCHNSQRDSARRPTTATGLRRLSYLNIGMEHIGRKVAEHSDDILLEQLLDRIADGDRTAFRQFYGATSGKLYGIAAGILGNSEDANDVTQETYLQIWQQARQFDRTRGTARAWAIRIARNRAIDRLRSRQVRNRVHSTAARENSDTVQEIVMPSLDRQGQARLLACLELLEPGQRESIMLAYCEGYTHQELTLRLDQPLGTVKSWIYRGMARLRECLRR